LYTNNKLTIAQGFKLPDNHPLRADIMPIPVGTDPSLALKTRKGTGLYKVPSLKGVWYRGLYGHDGAVASLEDWFDSARLREDYVPTGFNSNIRRAFFR
jgi:cytochrome c peroxidase